MKIAFVVNSLEAGGMENSIFNLATALTKLGHHVKIVTTERIGKWSHIPKIKEIEEIQVLPKPWENRIIHAKKIAETLSEFDACLLNHTKTAQSIIGLLPNHVCAISILHNFHEEIFKVGLENIENLNGSISVGYAVAQEAKRRTKGLLAIKYIPNGIFLPQTCHTRSAKSSDIKIIYIGRLEHNQKGVLHIPIITAKLDEFKCNYSLNIVGDGPDRQKLEELIGTDNKKIRFTGMLEPDKAMAILEKSDFLILPSHFEGQGLVLIESMARGVIPIATKIPGVTDKVIENGVDGFLIDKGDFSGFAKAIKSCAENKDIYDEISLNSIKRANKDFDINNIAQFYVNFINQSTSQNLQRNMKINKELLGKLKYLPYFIRNILINISKRLAHD